VNGPEHAIQHLSGAEEVALSGQSSRKRSDTQAPASVRAPSRTRLALHVREKHHGIGLNGPERGTRLTERIPLRAQDGNPGVSLNWTSRRRQRLQSLPSGPLLRGDRPEIRGFR
jgi:hypothetical protein